MNNGFIYCLSNEGFKDNIYKIGFTQHNIKNRLNQLYNTSMPYEFKVAIKKYVSNVKEVEKNIIIEMP